MMKSEMNLLNLRLSERNERYFYRDIYNEPNQYEMTVTAIHAKSSKDLFLTAIEVMIHKLETIQSHFINLTKQETTSILVSPHKDHPNTYLVQLCGQNDTIGNVLQSHIVNKHIQPDLSASVCGYKKSHPLEEHVTLYMRHSIHNMKPATKPMK